MTQPIIPSARGRQLVRQQALAAVAVIVRLGGAGVNVATSPKRSYNMATSLPSAACLPTFKADSGPDRKTMPHRAHQRRFLVSMNLHIGGLSFDTTDDGLRTFFEQAGTVESANVITDRDSGRSRGFGFVEMATEAEASKAIEEFNGKMLDGRTLTVNEAQPRKERG